MKRIIPIAILSLFTTALFAQTEKPFPKTISVTGRAEMEIIPDEIYVIVTLKEYEKKGTGKVDLETVKSDFLNTCRTAGLPDSVISIASYEGSNPRLWWKKKSKDELYATIAYQVKLTGSKKIDELVNKLDDNATQTFEVARVSHSKIQEYRKQVKIQAIKAAKAKAEYLTEAIGENLGTAVTISEPQADQELPLNLSQFQSNFMGNNGYVGKSEEGIDFKKIKIVMEINVVFALK